MTDVNSQKNKTTKDFALIATHSVTQRAVQLAQTQPEARIQRNASQAKREGWRETVESIVVAFILAFLFRTFVAEAFVIPTGSMAETLYGRHKDVYCSQCQTRFRVGASDEVERDQESSLYVPSKRVKSAYCPNCHFQVDLFKNPDTGDDVPVYKGDRILVNKFPYEFADPEHFDVVVFKYPVDPRTNYIKRLIGLPGQNITIDWGDVYRKVGENGVSEILRKPRDKQQAMQMLVYDNNKPARKLLQHGWPERWAALIQQEKNWLPDPLGWTLDNVNRAFLIDQAAETPDGQSATAAPQWIRYRHLVASPVDWKRVQEAGEGEQLGFEPQSLLIADYYAYNSGSDQESNVNDFQRESIGEHWVGDLTLDCTVEVLESRGTLLLELVEGMRRYRCAVNLRTGEADLYYQDDKWLAGTEGDDAENVPVGKAPTPLSKVGKHRICFANVDDRLSLWVDGSLIPLENDGVYPFSPKTESRSPTQMDLAPVGIAATGAKLRVSDLVLLRDIYYQTSDESDDHDDWRELLADPDRYGQYARRVTPDSFQLDDDEFLMLGDNSPRSLDSRLWTNPGVEHPYAVPRRLLIGKAFFVYWPHGIPFGNQGQGYHFNVWPLNELYFYHKQWDPNTGKARLADDMYPANRVPFYPQFGRMWFIE